MNVTIIGLARSGYAAAQLAHRLGYAVRVSDGCTGAHVTAATRRTLEEHAEVLRACGIWVELGAHTPACLDGATLVVTSPGVPDSAPPLQWARQRGVPVISEIEFAVRHTTARIVAITGTNGKTTTTTLIGHILNTAGMPVVVAFPGETATRFVPNCVNCVRMYSRAPSPSEVSRITEAMPITIPSMVRPERCRWPRIARKA